MHLPWIVPFKYMPFKRVPFKRASFKSLLLSGLLLSSAPSLALAQDGVMVSGDGMMFSVPDYGSVALTQSILRSSGKQGARSKGGQPEARSPKPGSTPATDLRVRYDPAVSRATERDYLANLEKNVGPKAAQAFGAYFAKKPVHSQFDIAAGPYGLRNDDLADVATAYFVVMWMAANQAPLPTRSQVDGVRRQLGQGIGMAVSLPTGAKQRQQMAETMMYKLVSTILLREEAQRAGNDGVLKQLAQAAQRDSGMDLRNTRLTRAGFVVGK